MGIDVLEEKFQAYKENYPERISDLEELAREISRVQVCMRKLLDEITTRICSTCEASCCMCMPVEGWFTESDYFAYRMFHEAPFDLRVQHDLETGCAFLGRHGCVLPKDIRPFPCVKVNCAQVTRALEENGTLEEFKKLYDELTGLQERVWPLLKDRA